MDTSAAVLSLSLYGLETGRQGQKARVARALPHNQSVETGGSAHRQRSTPESTCSTKLCLARVAKSLSLKQHKTKPAQRQCLATKLQDGRSQGSCCESLGSELRAASLQYRELLRNADGSARAFNSTCFGHAAASLGLLKSRASLVNHHMREGLQVQAIASLADRDGLCFESSHSPKKNIPMGGLLRL